MAKIRRIRIVPARTINLGLRRIEINLKVGLVGLFMRIKIILPSDTSTRSETVTAGADLLASGRAFVIY